jgi:hypothetical protein
MLLLVLSCTTSNVSTDKKFNSFIERVERQNLIAILCKEVEGIDIPKEYFFDDFVLVVDGDLIMVYDYENLMTYKKLLNSSEKDTLFDLLDNR